MKFIKNFVISFFAVLLVAGLGGNIWAGLGVAVLAILWFREKPSPRKGTVTEAILASYNNDVLEESTGLVEKCLIACSVGFTGWLLYVSIGHSWIFIGSGTLLVFKVGIVVLGLLSLASLIKKFLKSRKLRKLQHA
jgi:hypothetical protein